MASSCSTPTIPQRTVAEKRWHQAWESLKKEDKDEIKLDPTRTGYLDILQDIHNLATEKKELCIQKAWKYKKKNGTTIIVRDLFEKILVWVDKVKDIGDVIVSYDPGHAALPWAAVRLLLTIAVEDSQSLGILIEGLEQISKLIAQCKVLEDLYSQSAGDDTGFNGALLELYVAILTFESHAIQIYRKSTANRLISAIKLPSNKLQDGLNMVWVKHQRVTDCTRLIDAQNIRQFEDILRQFKQPIIRSATILQDYQDSLELQERETLLRWLSTIPYRKHHKLKRSEHLKGSCEWLLNSIDYNQWKDSSASSILWLNGIAGCGKSVLTSSVIDSLCQEASSIRTAAPVAYFYCSRNTAEPERANPEEVLRSILEQVSSNTANLPIRKPVVEVYTKLKEDNRGLSPQERLNLNETTEVLLKILQVDPFYVVIDALDECDPSERYSLIESLKTIIDESASVVKVFISSRRDYDIVSQLEESPCISIQPGHISNDIENYVKKEVSEAIEKKRIVKGKLIPEEKKKIEQQISQALIDGSQGMFRWVTLQIQQLCKQVRVKGDIDSVLRKLPKSLEDSYHLVYQDIMSMEEPSQKVAIRTLQVLLSTRRKLDLDEMLAAVTVEIDTDEVMVSTVDELLYVCCNLIIFDKGERILRFAHLSVREFLENCAPRDCFSIQFRELFLMNRCLYVFLYESCHVIIFKEQADEVIRKNKDFTYYAAEYWSEHCKLAQPDVVTSEFLKQFIGKDLDMGYSASHKRWLKAASYYKRKFDDAFTEHYHVGVTNASILTTSCIYGLMAIVMTLLAYNNIDGNAPVANYIGHIYYPLAYAAQGGHVMIVRQFLSRYSDYYAKGSPGHEIIYMSLCEAIQASHIEVAKTLLDYFMIDVNDPLTKKLISRYDSHSLLGIAVLKEREEMVKFLLHCGADANGETRSVIPSVESVNILETLAIYYGAHKPDDQYPSPLKFAVIRCNTAIVDTLCSFGADIMAKDSSGATLIHFLAKRNYRYGGHYNFGQCARIVDHLTRKGVDVAATDNFQRTALHFAVQNDEGLNDLVPVLVNAGTPINAQNSEGDTALNIFLNDLQLESDKRVLLLLSLGADYSIPNNNGLTALDKVRKTFKKLLPKTFRPRICRSIIELLTIASQDKIVEDIWRLFVDDS
ncbi:uncharacterized protein EAF02_004955 [Botrytis sinoallii]|uniref:uncharacterized protein n=1 Tax=Botrytis sinoallii TaxID=1463999 RepID=UPI0019005813|nr:uncharacterized protein EAF02_004955 [Botrytis sinoallii]KAF7884619.1 hypothetical protein EAF02_004955 [Botrytis sinoallii]